MDPFYERFQQMLEGGAKTPQAKKKPRMPYMYDEKKKMDAPWRLKGTSDCAKELYDEDLGKDVYDFRKCGDKDFVVRGRKTTGGSAQGYHLRWRTSARWMPQPLMTSTASALNAKKLCWRA